VDVAAERVAVVAGGRRLIAQTRRDGDLVVATAPWEGGP
jgi:hypothetical protein